MPDSDLEALNRRALRKLLVTVKANGQTLGLLVAICDDRNLQASIIGEYEAELKSQGITPFQARLDFKRPSLRATLEALVAQEPVLQTGEPAVVTVLNAEALLGVRLSEEKSEQEKFFFSLQWTREALLRFEFPVVLWVPDAVATRIGQRAPDFWSWRGGVFEFVARPKVVTEAGHPMPRVREVDTTDSPGQLSIADLQRQIEGLEEASPESSLLITSYNSLGEAYEREYARGEALALYEKALALARANNNLEGQVRSLINLGNALEYSGRSQQAIEYYEQSLKIAREIGDRKGEASSLHGLGNAYFLLGQYQRAVEFYQQWLEIAGETDDRKSEADSLSRLGNAYDSLGQPQRAIEFHQQSLETAREIGNRQGEANSLGNLGNAYDSLGQPQRAIEFHQQQLEIVRKIGDRQGQANSLGNLGNAYDSLGQPQRAIEFHQQSLTIKRKIGDRQDEANSLGNLGNAYYSLGQYQRAIEFHQQSLAITQEIGDRRGEAITHFNKGNVLARIDQKWKARSSYEAAKTLFKSLELQELVEQCDQAIRNLGQMI
ncbi:tetratricopeptide repeat protein [Leptolyngbya sp. BC1307]|uniref:tetratricopeptide repeat protein n=1 Tax=Leptolyngbya sp. BC1307 TaxID=2029589 RepID=UPI000EFA43CC|nr:tetratricopeptide repeat protein [Leptolyngbya sp. BC1307]